MLRRGAGKRLVGTVTARERKSLARRPGGRKDQSVRPEAFDPIEEGGSSIAKGKGGVDFTPVGGNNHSRACIFAVFVTEHLELIVKLHRSFAPEANTHVPTTKLKSKSQVS